MSNLTLARLKELVEYNEDDKTFVFIWKPRLVDNSGFNAFRAGTKAGCLTQQGYVHVRMDDHTYKLHRLVYMLKEGIATVEEIPDTIDHISRDTTDNTKSNIRDGSIDETNSKLNSRNRVTLGKSQYLGVALCDRKRNKYSAEISINFSGITLIQYKSEFECAEVYKATCNYLGYEVDSCYKDIPDIELPDIVKARIEKAKNTKIPEPKTCKYNGVVWSRHKQRYIASVHTYIGSKSKSRRVGSFNDEYEACIYRDLYIIENGFTNPLNILTPEQYQEYRSKYPKHQIKKLKVTSLETGDETIYRGTTNAGVEIHISKKIIGAILRGERENNYPYKFEWVYFDKN